MRVPPVRVMGVRVVVHWASAWTPPPAGSGHLQLALTEGARASGSWARSLPATKRASTPSPSAEVGVPNGIRKSPEIESSAEFGSKRDPGVGATPSQNDAKCPIVGPAVTDCDGSGSVPAGELQGAIRPHWEPALQEALAAAAQDVADQLAAEGRTAVERALLAGLEAARSEGRWQDVAALAQALEEHRRALGRNNQPWGGARCPEKGLG